MLSVMRLGLAQGSATALCRTETPLPLRAGLRPGPVCLISLGSPWWPFSQETLMGFPTITDSHSVIMAVGYALGTLECVGPE